MRGILPDSNCQGHFQVLQRLLADESRGELWNFLNLEVLTFDDLGLAVNISDRLLWQTCQQYDVVLITANRNADDPDSLEATIQDLNTPQSLPVVTLANVERIRRDRRYAEQVADQVLEPSSVFSIGKKRGLYLFFRPLCPVRLSVLYDSPELDGDMNITGIIGRNHAHQIRPSRRVAEPASPASERVGATYGVILIRWSTLELRTECIAIGRGKLRDPRGTTVLCHDHTGQPSESAQVRRITRTGSRHLATHRAIIVDRLGAGKRFIHMAYERTPIVP